MENEAAGFSDQDYREMDRGFLLFWVDKLEFGSVHGDDEAGKRALLALGRLGGLMGEW